ncbi:MAG: 5'-nucleotidase C-terminal domain-containing protein [Akkermansiaceae bacterium]|nr:5'-nucleotidase C-terminal domain-containing protein [Akkermansiaceae bacterium]
MKKQSSVRLARFASCSFALLLPLAARAEEVTILHVGDQESWLLSAQGNLRDNTSQPLSFYGGVDRLATLMNVRESANNSAGRAVVRVNAGDALLPGPRFNASVDTTKTQHLTTAHPDGGQDYYDAIAMRHMGFDVAVFGNHEFDRGLETAARFAAVAGTTYLSMNLNFAADPAFAALQTAGKVAPYITYTTPGGKKVAFVGVTTPLLPDISSPATLNLMEGFAGFNYAQTENQKITALSASLQGIINDLRTNQGVTVVVMVSHLQDREKELNVLLPLLTGVDAVISGGGHELETNANSTTIPTANPINGPTLPNPPLPYPTRATDNAAKSVPIYTANFGNRYLGEFTLQIDDTTGAVTGVTNEAVRRVSGHASDADAVTGDATISSSVITPVQNYVSALNAEIFATTEVQLNGERGSAGTTARSYTPGVRNAETNLGNLVADSGRFASGADVHLQNGGGVRASIAGPTSPATERNISIGDSFSTLTFLNIIVVDDDVSAAQLKAVLEHGFANSTTAGSLQGRFPQLSGMEVIFDTTRDANDRVRRVVLTKDSSTKADDVVIIDYGRVINSSIRFSMSTIDFLANGGDSYPFRANGFDFDNLVYFRNYQEAFVDYAKLPDASGGLAGKVRASQYDRVNAFDRVGRIVDMIYATGNRDTNINGTVGADFICGGPGADTCTGGAGDDTFVFTSVRDSGDIITDFVIGSDKLDVADLLRSMRVTSSAGALGTRLTFTNVGQNCAVNYVLPGAAPRILVTVNGTTAAQLNSASNFVF